jgi:hypothetical protein
MDNNVRPLEKERTIKGFVMINTLGETSHRTEMKPLSSMKLLLVCVGILS